MSSTPLTDILHVQPMSRSYTFDRLVALNERNVLGVVRLYDAQGLLDCCYTIPSFVFGYPSFNLIEIGRALVKRLRCRGFRVTLYSNGELLVNWKRLKKRLLREHKDDMQHQHQERILGNDTTHDSDPHTSFHQYNQYTNDTSFLRKYELDTLVDPS